MSAPLVVNTKDNTTWVLHTVTRAGLALYAVAGACACPSYLLATLEELAEHGIVGSADALPMPVGPQLPDFPPPPRTELEKLHAERARLQDLLAEAVTDAHRARRERDDMRERVSEPYGCTHCGITKRSHGRRYLSSVGMHAWTAPSQGQIAERMRARRTVRLAADNDRLRANLKGWSERGRKAEDELRSARIRVAELEARAAAGPGAEWWLAEYEGEKPELFATVEAARECCDDVAGVDAHGNCWDWTVDEHGVHVQFWTHPDDDRPLSETSGSVTPVVVQGAEPLRSRIAELEAQAVTARTEAIADVGDWLDENGQKDAAHLVYTVDIPAARAMKIVSLVEESTDKLTRLLAPTQALREDSHDGPLHHSYRVGRDLPETGGVRDV